MPTRVRHTPDERPSRLLDLRYRGPAHLLLRSYGSLFPESTSPSPSARIAGIFDGKIAATSSRASHSNLHEGKATDFHLHGQDRRFLPLLRQVRSCASTTSTKARTGSPSSRARSAVSSSSTASSRHIIFEGKVWAFIFTGKIGSFFLFDYILIDYLL